MANGLNTVITSNADATSEALNKLNTFMNDRGQMDLDIENKLNDLKVKHLDALKERELNNRLEIEKQLLAKGFTNEDLKAARDRKTRIASLEEQYAKLSKLEDKASKKKAATIKEQLEQEYKDREKYDKKINKETSKLKTKQQKADLAQLQKEANELVKSTGNFGKIGLLSKKERQNAVEELKKQAAEKGKTLSDEDAKKAVANAQLANAAKALSNYADKLSNDIKSISNYKSAIDTRLQGWGGAKTAMGSYWDQMSRDVISGVGLSPYIKQSAVNENISKLVNQGIAYDVEQRAFLETISDKIASTFEATDGTLLRLVRIQQQDSTAARLGMESALTGFLNSMYETSEYMQSIADQVRSSLEEAESLMGTQSAAAFEYQVQKWLGSMYSVGMSQNAVQGIANVVGQVAAGDISSLNGSGAGNLVIMAANKAGMSVADILNNGITGDETNSLMQAMVDYLAGIYNDTKDSLVVQQQYANVFGVAASDLKAAANLSSSVAAVAATNATYNDMYSRLVDMANTMYKRTSTGEMITNALDNFNYSMAAGVASNPVMYGLYAMASMLKDTTGGIDFSLPLVMGSGTAQTFNVADIMKVGALSGGILTAMGPLFSSFSNGGGFSGSGMLKGFGITGNANVVSRGAGSNIITTSGMTTSESAIIGNASSEDIQSKAMTDTTDNENQKVQNATDSSDQVQLKDVDEHIVNIYTLLQSVTNGTAKLAVTLGGEEVWTKSTTL